MWKLFFRLSILALAIVCSVASWSLETVRHDSGVMEQNDGVPSHLRRSINVSVKADEVCVFDRLKIDWEAGPFTDLDAVGIAFMSMGSKVGRVLSLQSMLKIDHIDPLLISIDGLIRCDVNEEHCVPKVQSISALPDQNRIVVLFEVATTQPLLQDVFSLQEALIVRPEIRFPGAFAEWVAPDRLEIQVDSIDMQALLTTHSKGGLIEAVPRSSKSYVKKGSSVIRPAEPGSYEVIVVDRANGMQQLPASEANAHIVKVEACEDAEVITTRHVEGLQIQAGGIPSNSAAPQSSPLSPGPKQTLVVQGPAAITGRQPMTFADGTVDPKVTFYICTAR